MLTVVCAKTRKLWVFQTTSKRAPLCIVCFVLTALLNGKYPFKRVRFDKDIAMVKTTDVTNLLVDEFTIYMETTGVDSPWIN